MAVCAGMIFAPASGTALVAPIALLAVISLVDDVTIHGLAQGPPARPPKA
jgi:hypothetical protein